MLTRNVWRKGRDGARMVRRYEFGLVWFGEATIYLLFLQNGYLLRAWQTSSLKAIVASKCYAFRSPRHLHSTTAYHCIMPRQYPPTLIQLLVSLAECSLEGREFDTLTHNVNILPFFFCMRHLHKMKM